MTQVPEIRARVNSDPVICDDSFGQCMWDRATLLTHLDAMAMALKSMGAVFETLSDLAVGDPDHDIALAALAELVRRKAIEALKQSGYSP